MRTSGTTEILTIFSCHFLISGIIHELIIECSPEVYMKDICEQMGRSPYWMPNILIKEDEYQTFWYRKD